MSNPSVIFGCPVCKAQITLPLTPLPAGQSVCLDDGEPAVPRGLFLDDKDNDITGWEKRVLVNLADLVGTKHHTDAHRLNGCCGHDGLDGPNVTCEQGHEVATEKSDCWMPHCALLLPNVSRSAVR
jgi:hypothetical protein